MKIVIVQGAFLPVPAIMGGAVEKIWFHLARELASYGHEVTHIGRAHPRLASEEKVAGVKYIRVSGFNAPASLTLLKAMDLVYSTRAVRRIPEDADIILTNTFWSPLLLSGKSRKKVMVSVERWPKGQMKLYWRAARLRASTAAVAAAIRSEIPAKQRHRVITIPNPLPFSVIPPDNLHNKKKIILYVGRLHPEKGLEILLRAFNGIKSDWKLCVVGPWQVDQGGGGKHYLNSLLALASEARGVVEFAGPVYDAERLNRFYADAMVFVYPSVAERGETFGLAPLEAMAWGCIPIVSALSCFKDFVHADSNGLIFNHHAPDAASALRNAIDSLCEMPSLCCRLSKAAMKVNETHSISVIASMFMKEFEIMLRKENANVNHE